MSWKPEKKGRYAARIYFRDGNKRTLWSREKEHKWSDEKGLAKLRAYITENANRIDTALIYDKETNPDRLIDKYVGKTILFK